MVVSSGIQFTRLVLLEACQLDVPLPLTINGTGFDSLSDTAILGFRYIHLTSFKQHETHVLDPTASHHSSLLIMSVI